MLNKKISKGYIFVFFSAVIFGLMPLMAKYIYAEGVAPISLVFLRSIMSVPCPLVLALISGQPVRIQKSAVPAISFAAIMGCCITPMLLYTSYKYIPSGAATVLHFIYPAAVIVGEALFLKYKIKALQVISVLLCIAGIAMYYNPKGGINFEGGFYAISSGLAYAAYVVCLTGFKHKSVPCFTFNMYTCAVSAVFMFFVCILGKNLTLPQTVRGWLLIFIFATSINVGAIMLFQFGTFLIGGGKSSVLSAFEPVTSIIAGIIIFNEPVSVYTVLGSVLVIAATLLIAAGDLVKQKE